MFKDHAFEQTADHALFLFIKTGNGLELQAQVIVRAALVFAEKEHIRTHHLTLSATGTITEVRLGLLLLAACSFVYGNVPLSENSRLGLGELAHTSRQGIGPANALTAPGISECLCDSGRRSRCAGKERDAETGLDYFGARYMSAAQGRFTSPDPGGAGASLFNPQSWNGYSYVNNRPLTHVDPDGEIPIPVITGAVGAGVGAIANRRERLPLLSKVRPIGTRTGNGRRTCF